MTTVIYSHDVCARHEIAPGHPEQAARLAAVDEALADLAAPTVRAEPGPAEHDALIRAHTPRYVDTLFEIAPSAGTRQLDADTAMNAFSLDAARRASGALIEATDAVLAGEYDNAFCNVRPPGHHAESQRAMGFCLFNHVAVGVHHALHRHGLERVAIIDFDVHSGNGTEEIFRGEPRVLFCNSYQYPLYPNINTPSVEQELINVPLAAGTDGGRFRAAVRDAWVTEIEEFRPQAIYVSAGFDAHRDDPLAGLALLEEDYAWLGDAVLDLADRLCDGNLIATLEGGYDLTALGRSAAAFVGRIARA